MTGYELHLFFNRANLKQGRPEKVIPWYKVKEADRAVMDEVAKQLKAHRPTETVVIDVSKGHTCP